MPCAWRVRVFTAARGHCVDHRPRSDLLPSHRHWPLARSLQPDPAAGFREACPNTNTAWHITSVLDIWRTHAADQVLYTSGPASLTPPTLRSQVEQQAYAVAQEASTRSLEAVAKLKDVAAVEKPTLRLTTQGAHRGSELRRRYVRAAFNLKTATRAAVTSQLTACALFGICCSLELGGC